MTTSRPTTSCARRARSRPAKSRDRYASDHKARDAMVCDRCSVVRHGGRWYWGAPPLGEVLGGLCPACERIRDRAPAGTLRLSAAMTARRDEVVNVIRAVEAAERDEHPLERVMQLEQKGGLLYVSTTGVHLARRITARLQRRFHAKARVARDHEQGMRVEWDA